MLRGDRRLWIGISPRPRRCVLFGRALLCYHPLILVFLPILPASSLIIPRYGWCDFSGPFRPCHHEIRAVREGRTQLCAGPPLGHNREADGEPLGTLQSRWPVSPSEARYCSFHA